MNRETRRRLKQNNVSSIKQTIIPSDLQKAIDHQRISKAFDDGIKVGWHAASMMIEKVAQEVKGIGKVKASEIRRLFENTLDRIERESEE